MKKHPFQVYVDEQVEAARQEKGDKYANLILFGLYGSQACELMKIAIEQSGDDIESSILAEPFLRYVNGMVVIFAGMFDEADIASSGNKINEILRVQADMAQASLQGVQ